MISGLTAGVIASWRGTSTRTRRASDARPAPSAMRASDRPKLAPGRPLKPASSGHVAHLGEYERVVALHIATRHPIGDFLLLRIVAGRVQQLAIDIVRNKQRQRPELFLDAPCFGQLAHRVEHGTLRTAGCATVESPLLLRSHRREERN